MLTYECAKELCMISKSEKASLIRKYYIELEKLIIMYKDEIDESINRQLGIKLNNNKIIKKNEDTSLIYVLKSDTYTYKIGSTADLKKRLKQYNVGHLYELPIVFVMKTNNTTEIENCLKMNLKKYQAKNKTELYAIDLNFIRDTSKYCAKANAILIKKNNKLYNGTEKWAIIIDKKNVNIDNLFKKKKLKKSTKKGSKT